MSLDIFTLIEDGESETVEFKRKFSTSPKIAKEMIAFANTKGGCILFGVDDDKSISGVESEKSELDLIDTAARFYCEPEIKYTTEIIPFKTKDVVAIIIPESNKKPHKLVDEGDKQSSRVYIRYKDKSIIASKETASILKFSNFNNSPLVINLGDTEKILLKYLEENDNISVKEFKKLANISERRAGRTLVNLVRAGVLRHHRLNGKEFFTNA
ncbi:MAG: ATP-binding protein [Candidatus Kapaibacterium sp.]